VSPLAGDAHAVVPYLVTETEHLELVALGAQTGLGRSLGTGDAARVRDTAESFMPAEEAVCGCSDDDHTAVEIPIPSVVDVLRERGSCGSRSMR
jgi:hypothetical protein